MRVSVTIGRIPHFLYLQIVFSITTETLFIHKVKGDRIIDMTIAVTYQEEEEEEEERYTAGQ